LLGRRAPSSEAQKVIDALTEAGVTAVAMQGDVGTETVIAAVLEKIRTTMPPLRGILHAAGSVDDGLIAEQSLERFERIMAPKVDGTWHLQAHSRKDPLDFFVLFSSGAALLGSPGQSNYAFANGFMDALAFHRKAEGRPALSINWGSWSEVGMAAAVSEQHQRRWAESGLRMIRPTEGVRMMHDTLSGTRSAQVAILPLDRARLSPLLGPFFQRLMEKAAKATAAPANVPTDLPQRLAEAAPEGRAPIVTAFLVDQLVRVLAVDAATRLHTDQSLMDMGLDSLMAMELRNRVQAAVKVRLSVAELLTGQTIDQLTLRILGAMDLAGAPAAPPQEAANYEEGSL
jgi:aryl carrier-like protein